jgi:hypothetical protein
MGFEVRYSKERGQRGGSAPRMGRWWCHSTAWHFSGAPKSRQWSSRSIFEELRIRSWKHNCARGVHPFCHRFEILLRAKWVCLRCFEILCKLQYVGVQICVEIFSSYCKCLTFWDNVRSWIDIFDNTWWIHATSMFVSQWRQTYITMWSTYHKILG